MNPKKTGEYILKKRKDKKITQQELAELLNVTNKAISRWETGEGYPDISLLPQLAIILQCSVDDILAGEDVKEQEEKKSNKRISLGAFTLTFCISIAFILFISILIAYASFYEWIGATLLGLTCLGCSIAYIFLRLNHLNKCEYSNKDKKYIFINTVAIYSTIFLAILSYLPLIIHDPNLTEQISIKKSIISFDSYKVELAMALFVGSLINIFIVIIHYIVLFNKKWFKHFSIFIGISLITTLICLSTRDALGLFILWFELLIALIVLAILKFKFKKNIKTEIFILLLAFFAFYTLYNVYESCEWFLISYTSTNSYDFDYYRVNPFAIHITSLILLIPHIKSVINIKRNNNKLLNIYILFISIAYIIIMLIVLLNTPGWIHYFIITK